MTYEIYDKTVQALERDETILLDDVPHKRVSIGAFKDVRFDPDDSSPNYIGLASKSLATSDTSWTVLKFTYSGDNVTRIQKATGAWDSRASLF